MSSVKSVFAALIAALLASPAISDTAVAQSTAGAVKTSNRVVVMANQSNGRNSVRDDMGAYINSLASDAQQTQALRQFTASINNALTVDTANHCAVNAAEAGINQATSQLFHLYDVATADRLMRNLERLTVNTPTSAMAYIQFHASVRAARTASNKGTGCAGENKPTPLASNSASAQARKP